MLIQYQKDNWFVVLESENSKLEAGDRMEITCMIQDYPLVAANVLRNGVSMGSFTAGKSQGINFTLV